MSQTRTLLVAFGLMIGLATGARGQDAAALRGRILERLATGEVVIDLGAEDGIVLGAVLTVERAGRRIARLRIEDVRSQRAVAEVLDEREEVAAGDEAIASRSSVAPLPPAVDAGPARAPTRELAPTPAPEPRPEPRAPIPTAAPGQAPAPLTPEEVLARLAGAGREPIEHRKESTGPDGGKSESPGDAAATQAKPGYAATGRPRRAGGPNRVTGSLRLGYDVSLENDEFTDFTNHGPRAGLTVRVDRIADQDLTLRFRGSARLPLGDLKDRTGGDLDPQLFLTEASLAWAPDLVPVELEVGRIGLFDAATIGSVDGARAALRLGPIRVGAFGGLDPRPDLSDRGRTKLGGYARFETPPGETWSLDAAIAYARTTTRDGDVERSLVASDVRVRLVPFATLYARTEFDLYGQTDTLLDRGSAELTSIYGSVSVRPVAGLSVTAAFDRRLPFIGTEAVADLDPAVRGQLPDDVLTGLRFDARYRLPQAWWIRGAVDVRRGSFDMTTVTAQVGWDAVLDRDIWASLQGQGWSGDLVRGGGGRFTVGTAVTTALELDLSYEAARDEHQRTTDIVWRHTIQGDAFVFFSRSWTGALTVGYDTGDEIDRFFGSATITLRF